MTFGPRVNRFGLATLLCAICAVRAAAGVPADPPARGAAEPGPAPGTYRIDPNHTFAYFGARHQLFGLVRGRFDKTEGTITVALDPAACSLDVSIDTSSISTQNAERDADLRGPDYFDVKDFPAITYRGRGVRRETGNTWTMDGSLTIRGVTKVVPLRFTFNGTIPTKPGKRVRLAFHGTAGARRGDFGMTRDLLQELGPSPSPGPDVDLEIDVEAAGDAPAPAPTP